MAYNNLNVYNNSNNNEGKKKENTNSNYNDKTLIAIFFFFKQLIIETREFEVRKMYLSKGR